MLEVEVEVDHEVAQDGNSVLLDVLLVGLHNSWGTRSCFGKTRAMI